METHENYQKQTYRSRTHIYGANGLLALNVPVRHMGRGGVEHQLMSQTMIADEFRWQREHFRSLETAYRTSPYFEFYEDTLSPIFDTPTGGSLLDLNMETHRVVCRLLDVECSIQTTSEYEKSPSETLDLRGAFLPKKQPLSHFEPYTQVFEHKNGFLPNMSILDLIFCVGGREALSYLQDLELKL